MTPSRSTPATSATSHEDTNPGSATDNATTPIVETPRRGTSSSSTTMPMDCSPSPSGVKDLTPVQHKIVYLIRHGESLGQLANEYNRRRDARLVDCGLSENGIIQANTIPQLLNEAMDEIELVISSPLTRAVQTTCIAFPTKPILINYDLREVGTMIPENIPRAMKHVLADLQIKKGYEADDTSTNRTYNIDSVTLQPQNWPRNHDTTPKVCRRDQIRQVFQWIAVNRPERVIAIVCHYHVIRAALDNPTVSPRKGSGGKNRRLSSSSPLGLSSPGFVAGQLAASTQQHANVRPINAYPIKCYLDVTSGQLFLAKEDKIIPGDERNCDT